MCINLQVLTGRWDDLFSSGIGIGFGFGIEFGDTGMEPAELDLRINFTENQSWRQATGRWDESVLTSFRRSGYEPWIRNPCADGWSCHKTKAERGNVAQAITRNSSINSLVLQHTNLLVSQRALKTSRVRARKFLILQLCNNKAKIPLAFRANSKYYIRCTRNRSARDARVTQTNSYYYKQLCNNKEQIISNTPVFKHRPISNPKNHIEQSLNVRRFSTTAGRRQFSRIQTTITQFEQQRMGNHDWWT